MKVPTAANFGERRSLLKKLPPDLTRGLEPGKPGSKRPKTALSAPAWGSEKGAREFFNRLAASAHLGE